MDTLKQELKSLLITALNLEDLSTEDITDDMPLFSEEGLGLDSVDGLELGLALKKKYGVTLNSENADMKKYFQSINTLDQYIRQFQK